MTDFENPTLINQTLPEKTNDTELRYKNEIDSYKKLIEVLSRVDGLSIDSLSTQGSLAFLVEEIKKNTGDDWPPELLKLVQQIETLNQEKGKLGVSGFLSGKINQYYLHFLKIRSSEIADEALKRKLAIMQKMVEQMVEFNRKMQGSGRAVTLGGVSHDYIPDWFYSIKK